MAKKNYRIEFACELLDHLLNVEYKTNHLPVVCHMNA